MFLTFAGLPAFAVNWYYFLSGTGSSADGQYWGADVMRLHIHFVCGPNLPPGNYRYSVSQDGNDLIGGTVVWDGVTPIAAVVGDASNHLNQLLYSPPSAIFTSTAGPEGGNEQLYSATTIIPVSVLGVHDYHTPPAIIDVDVNVSLGATLPKRGCTGRGDGAVGGTGGDCGMAGYTFESMLASLHVMDHPLSYRPAFGPPVDFSVFYDHRDYSSLSGYLDSTLFGYKWRHNWQAYLLVGQDPPDLNSQVTEFPRGGGSIAHVGYDSSTGKFVQQVKDLGTLHRIGANQYEKVYPDGSREVYAQSDQTTYPRRIFLTQVTDAFGNAVTLHYTYARLAGQPFFSTRLDSIVDATQKITSFVYDLPSYPLLPTRVIDPFGRTATFNYVWAQLQSITDPLGITSSFTYGVSDPLVSDSDGESFISSLTTPYGTTQFSQGHSADGTTMWAQATDPLGGTERAEFRLNRVTALPAAEAGAPAGFESRNAGLDFGNSYFWSRKAMMVMGAATDPSLLDCTKAQITHWLATADGKELSGVVASEKSPLEGRIWYSYENQPAFDRVGSWVVAYQRARLVEDGAGNLVPQISTAEHAPASGLLTKAIDPLGRQRSYSYDPANQVDLLEVRQTTGTLNDLLWKGENYANHQPWKVTDAAGKATLFEYNSRGQLAKVTNARNEVTKLTYFETVQTPPLPYFARLQQVTRAFGTPLATSTNYTYEPATPSGGAGRLQTATNDADGYAVTFAYDAIGGDPLKSLDRLVKTVYPDGTFTHQDYLLLDVSDTYDRTGRNTHFTYDALRHQTTVTDPLGRLTQFVHCPCGALDKIIDPAGNVTQWTRDLMNRPQTKSIGGQAVATEAYEPQSGRVQSRTDALNQVTTYAYYADDALHTVQYANALHATPNVAYEYEAAYPRLHSVTDTASPPNLYVYTYQNAGSNGAGALASVDGPLTDDTITYSYDELGRLDSRAIGAGSANTATWDFDSLARQTGPSCTALSSDPAQPAPFTFSYVGRTERLDHIDYPNQQRSTYAYAGLLPTPAGSGNRDFHMQSITNLGVGANGTGALLSKFGYTYDSADRISDWSLQDSSSVNPQHYVFGYDSADQLVAATLKDSVTNATVHQYGYDMDLAGSRQNTFADGTTKLAATNGLNELLTFGGESGSVLLKGAVSKPSALSVNGAPIAVNGLNFSVPLSVTSGVNNFTILATESQTSPGFHPQSSSKLFQITIPAGQARAYDYDLVGNTTSLKVNGILTRTFEWDAANRLVAINYLDSGNRTDFSYDGLSRRVRILETGSNPSDKRFVWSGTAIAEERSGTGAVTKRFLGLGEDRAGLKLFYFFDHLGSLREVTDATGALRARYAYGPWGERSKVSGDLEADAGFTGHYNHGPSDLALPLFRAYDATTARWLSRDLIGEAGGTNLYAYALCDPINSVDPLGLLDIRAGLNNAAASAYNMGGALGNVLGIAVNVGSTIVDVLGGELVEQLAAKSGAAAGRGCYGRAVLYSAATIGVIALAVIPGEGAAAEKGFFEGTSYTSKVLKQMEGGVGEFHSFPESVTAFESAGTVRTITGGDKVVREMLEIPGSYGGRDGVFQFIKNADGTINHRLFVPKP